MKASRMIKICMSLTLMFLLTLTFYAPRSLTASTVPSAQTSQKTIALDSQVLTSGSSNMTFTSGTTMNLTTGITITMRTGIKFQFLPQIQGMPIESCFMGTIITQPTPPQLLPCSWWEILDQGGLPTGFEFHVDVVYPSYFHIDTVFPGPFPVPWQPITAELKITTVQPCSRFTVIDPSGTPQPCSWWEIVSPISNYEFHVDSSYPNGTFHIDQVTPGSITFPVPPPYQVQAEKKIDTIAPCTNLEYISSSGYVPQPCDWWEITYPSALKGKEFHIDTVQNPYIHIDNVYPSQITGIEVYKLIVEKKIPTINPCDWFKIATPAGWAPNPCSWWNITAPTAWKGITFHVDQNTTNPYTFHVDIVNGQIPSQSPPPYNITAKSYSPPVVHDVAVTAVAPLFASVFQGWPDPIDVTVQNLGGAAETFTVTATYGTSPVTTSPITVSGLAAHSSTSIRFWWITTGVPLNTYVITANASRVSGETNFANNGFADGNVTVLRSPNFYWKPGFADYAPSGMPDFDERQDQWVNPQGSQTWTYCGPTAVADVLWWLDSEFERAQPPVAPPTTSDTFPLVSSYVAAFDDHNPVNVQPLIQHLAYLMDCDGQRTGIAHSGTYADDMQAALAQYLSWTGLNPLGDVNGDGIVNGTDLTIVNAAMGTHPGQLGWNLAADIYPITTGWPHWVAADNVIDVNDRNLVTANMGKKGMFNESYMNARSWLNLSPIEPEVKKDTETVILQLGYWLWTGQSWTREGGHYVAVAGINATQGKIAISDPIHDAFETGLIAQGRVPIPHVHNPPEPPYGTHNDAAYVSQDIYDVAVIQGMPQPCPEGNLYLVNFPGGSPNPLFTVIEAAIVIGSQGTHDVAVTNVQRLKTIVGQTYTCKFNVTVQNLGNFTETFNVTVYVGTMPPSPACKKLVSSLTQGETRTVTLTWNTTQWAYGNYSISAFADIVLGETNKSNNTFNDSWVLVTIPGDVNGDTTVNVLDLIKIANHLGHTNGDGHTPFTAIWYECMNTDIQGDNAHNVLDLIICASHLGQHW